MSAGGTPVLAHPFSSGDARAMVSRLAPVGLAGLEVWYGEYSPEQREELRQLAEGNGLIPTGGSEALTVPTSRLGTRSRRPANKYLGNDRATP